MDSSHPFHLAWLGLNGNEPIPARPQVMARILLHDENLSPRSVGIELFEACMAEILSDSDTYSEELQIRAAYLKLKHIEVEERFQDGPVVESI